ncbi:coiled-coil domain-containing protein 120 [Harpia harpyja]|uniref:coiled-coil domain-containing protein 120 n=1 Tax=Harpia harpyja TaxID=202280 RepID=UPI0022B2120C|nr:coiled-coil domain-containing protein 120 [Harpia harpyja]
MEVRGHIIPPGTYSPAGAPAGRLQELRERQRGLRQALGLRLRELRRLCLQEAELTGKLPPEYPLEPGERPQPPPRRRAGGPPRGPLPEAARAARREVAVQLQVVEAARRLAAAPGLPPEQRRRRQRLQAEAAQRLRQLRAQLGAAAAAHDENGSLCDLPALENGALPGLPPPKPPPSGTGRPSPPRAGSGSPDRRPPWVPEAAVGGPGRRSSLASPASPARTLPRSASSFEGRSVPATPVLARSPCARGHPLCRPEAPGLPPRPWSGSQDSQLGGPPGPRPPAAGPPHPPQQQLGGLDRLGGPPRKHPRGRPGSGGPPFGPSSAAVRSGWRWRGCGDWYLRHTGAPPAAPPGPRLPPPRPRLGPPPPRPPRPAPLAQLRRGPGAQGLGGLPCGCPPSHHGPTAPRHPGVTPRFEGSHSRNHSMPHSVCGEGSPDLGGDTPKFGGKPPNPGAPPPDPLLASGRFRGAPVACPPREQGVRQRGGEGGGRGEAAQPGSIQGPAAIALPGSFLGKTVPFWGSLAAPIAPVRPREVGPCVFRTFPGAACTAWGGGQGDPTYSWGDLCVLWGF